jgi:hypothetical protein
MGDETMAGYGVSSDPLWFRTASREIGEYPSPARG